MIRVKGWGVVVIGFQTFILHRDGVQSILSTSCKPFFHMLSTYRPCVEAIPPPDANLSFRKKYNHYLEISLDMICTKI